VLHGTAGARVDETTRRALETVVRTYSMSAHAESASAQGEAVPPEFAHRFGIYGPPEHCVERLRDLEAAGVERAAFIPPLKSSDPDGVTMRRIGEEVIPALAVTREGAAT